jgi:hypothetical protein
MKPTAERYQAAMKVNAISPEIDDFEKADSVQELEGSTVHSVKASCELLFRDRRQGHGIERIASEPGRAFVLLAQQTHFGYVCRNNPGRCRVDTQPVMALRTKGIGGVDVYKPEKGKESSKVQRQSDMLIVVMKRGNARGAKGHALLCKDLRKH